MATPTWDAMATDVTPNTFEHHFRSAFGHIYATRKLLRAPLQPWLTSLSIKCSSNETTSSIQAVDGVLIHHAWLDDALNASASDRLKEWEVQCAFLRCCVCGFL